MIFIPLLLSFILGLIVGSFLNVVIHRLPLILQQEWRQQCLEYLEHPKENEPSVNLCLPHSHCPKCKKTLAWWHNIPVISYLLLRGKCHYCKEKISWRYPVVEILTAVVTLYLTWLVGLNWLLAVYLIFSWTVITLLFIDLEQQILPDNLTLGLLWLGLLINSFSVLVSPVAAILGAIAGYMSLWTVNKLYYLVKKREGMGYGDFKLLAALGAWLGIEALPMIILIAAGSGSIIGILWLIIHRKDRYTPIPFGPFLATAGWVYLILESYNLCLS